ncbi:oligopeptidase B, partial [Pseudoxanthomonas jiangsuensis]
MGDHWTIRTNAPGADGNPATNFKLVTAADGSNSRKDWTDWGAHRDDVLVEGFELFDGFTVVAERSNALERLRIIRDGGGEECVKADEPAYSMGLSTNAESNTDWLRYRYTSMTTPSTTYELNVRTGERRLLKQQPVPGYDPANYVTERLWATARDGTRIPVSLVYR